ncbi:MAG: ABC transporter permease subunit [Halobacteriovoraceae bacterium]|nr:ABC transporter permease subunit [Halobacteriovoraceae bacterium]MCB9095363.1 ABC transporter permease subunit [Halobacteriovoraceae bacterium]
MASFLLEKGYGCEVDVIPGTTTPLLTALGSGDIDILMEVWKDNFKDAWEKFEEQGKVIDAGVNFPDAIQGFYVPSYMIHGDVKRNIKPMAPDLKEVKDLIKYKNLFTDPEEPNKGRFLNCILGWSCESVNTKKFYAYGLDKHFTNFRPGTGAALAAAIASKYERGEPFLAYYWGPTWVLGKYDLTQVKEPAYDPQIWSELEKSERPNRATAYPVVKVYIGVNTQFAEKNPLVMDFLNSYQTSNQQISQALSYMQENEERTPKDAALNFLKKNENIWERWLDDEAVEKVELALQLQKSKKKKWKLDIGKPINNAVSWIVKNYGQSFKNASRPMLKLIIVMEQLFKFFPWWGVTLIFCLLSLLTGHRTLPLIIGVCLGGIKLLGMWSLAIQTLSLMIISTFIAAFLGFILGILNARFAQLRKLMLPFLDAMQTMPSFVYLIPALMLFGLGKVPAVFATVIYAIVPMIRLTDLGIRKVDPHVIEAAKSFGANYFQLLFGVRITLALPTIMAGINQTTMMALSMVVIASMIGARGLGEQVLLGIQKLDVGKGFTAGLAIVLLAISLDRLTQAFGRKLDGRGQL